MDTRDKIDVTQVVAPLEQEGEDYLVKELENIAEDELSEYRVDISKPEGLRNYQEYTLGS
jgi:hypothetical protein